MPSIDLQSSDGEIFPVDLEVAKVSHTIKNMLESLGIEEGTEDIFPLPKVNAKTLKKVIQWATHHKDDHLGYEESYEKMETEETSSWDREFLKVDKETLYELIQAADFLEIKGLLTLTCKAAANRILGMNADEIREVL